MIMDGDVTISKDEYVRLLLRETELDMLEGGGVDNWDWYSDSLYPEEGDTFDDYEKQIMNHVESL